MVTIKVGNNESSIQGKHITYNIDTFVGEVYNADRIICITNDEAFLKQVVLGVKTARVPFVYIGLCDTEYLKRKLPNTEVYTSIEDCPYKAKSKVKSPSYFL